MILHTGFRSLLLLAPPRAYVPESFGTVSVSSELHSRLLSEAQTLRGQIYLEDGAIGREQLVNGRHIVESDRRSWHLLVLDSADKVCGCARYSNHPSDVAFSQLGVAGSSLAACPVWGAKARVAIEEELALSRNMNLSFVEIGGWALADEIRGTVEAVRMVLAAYAFFRAFGGAIGLATATTRHSSASILRRIGGRPLKYEGQEVPSYRDLHYDCNMEMLRFYSWAPNPRYDLLVREVAANLRQAPVICSSMAQPGWIPSSVAGINTLTPHH